MVKLLTELCALVVGVLLIYAWWTQPAEALQSNNFQFVETSLGGTGLLDTESNSFQASTSAGLIGLNNTANTASTFFQTHAGHLTTGDPTLAFAINSGSVNLGNFSTASAATATSTFEVINYTSFGYVVQIAGTPPTYNGHTIAAMGSTGPSQAGVEQFGINLVANTSPVSVGSNPDNGQFGFGAASTNYDTPNNYRFVNGETIAQATKSSGDTIYTISYLVNVTSLTPGGAYTTNQTLICTGTY